MEQADSLAVDLHKWFFMPLTAGVLLTRHEQEARELFRVDASYIPDAGHVQAYCRGLPTSRRLSGLAVWFALRTAGWSVIREAIERNIQLTRDLERQLAQRGLRVMAAGQLSIACARWEPEGWSGESIDRLQQAIADDVCRRGVAWFATTLCRGKIWLRFNMVNLHSQQSHVDQLVQLVVDAAQRLSQKPI
jgi:glutamate/tyrosine decarboxylase-like PLP-dependent enzyme